MPVMPLISFTHSFKVPILRRSKSYGPWAGLCTFIQHIHTMRVVAKHKNSKRPRFTIPTSAAGAMSMYQLLSPPFLFAFLLLLSKPNGLFDRNGEFTVESFERFVRWEIETVKTCMTLG